MSGAKILGELPASGIGTALQAVTVIRDDRMHKESGEHNAKLLQGMSEYRIFCTCSLLACCVILGLVQDEFSTELLAASRKDADLGRMSMPVPVTNVMLDEVGIVVY